MVRQLIVRVVMWQDLWNQKIDRQIAQILTQ